MPTVPHASLMTYVPYSLAHCSVHMEACSVSLHTPNVTVEGVIGYKIML